MAKSITYKGKTGDELNKSGLNEFMKLTTSRVRRSMKRGFTEQQKLLLKKIKLAKEGKFKKNIKTHCRNMVVLPEILDLLIFIYDGKSFIPIKISEEMLGHYLGEFAMTRKKVSHSAPGIGATKSSAAASVK